MNIEKLKIWLNFTKFILGSVILGFFSLYLNNKIQKGELDLKAQHTEYKYMNKYIGYYVKEGTGINQRISLIKFLKYITLNEDRKTQYSILYDDLVLEKELSIDKEISKTKERAKIQDSMINIENSKSRMEVELISLNKKINSLDNRSKSELEKQIATKINSLDSLEVLTDIYQSTILEKDRDINNIKKKIDSNIKIESKLDIHNFSIYKGETYNLPEIGVLFVAEKINNITNRVLIKIITGEKDNMPIYSLKKDRYCIFYKNNIEYKLLVNNITNENGKIGNSKADFSIETL